MYDNIGAKIKGLAKAVFVIEAILAVIAGFYLMVNTLIVFGVLVLLMGPLVAWISSWLLYGFGELIDKTCDIERNTRNRDRRSTVQSQPQAESKQPQASAEQPQTKPYLYSEQWLKDNLRGNPPEAVKNQILKKYLDHNS